MRARCTFNIMKHLLETSWEQQKSGAWGQRLCCQGVRGGRDQVYSPPRITTSTSTARHNLPYQPMLSPLCMAPIFPQSSNHNPAPVQCHQGALCWWVSWYCDGAETTIKYLSLGWQRSTTGGTRVLSHLEKFEAHWWSENVKKWVGFHIYPRSTAQQLIEKGLSNLVCDIHMWMLNKTRILSSSRSWLCCFYNTLKQRIHPYVASGRSSHRSTWVRMTAERVVPTTFIIKPGQLPGQSFKSCQVKLW